CADVACPLHERRDDRAGVRALGVLRSFAASLGWFLPDARHLPRGWRRYAPSHRRWATRPLSARVAYRALPRVAIDRARFRRRGASLLPSIDPVCALRPAGRLGGRVQWLLHRDPARARALLRDHAESPPRNRALGAVRFRLQRCDLRRVANGERARTSRSR